MRENGSTSKPTRVHVFGLGTSTPPHRRRAPHSIPPQPLFLMFLSHHRRRRLPHLLPHLPPLLFSPMPPHRLPQARLSGECRLQHTSTDVRVALRLLHSLEVSGVQLQSDRLAGLLSLPRTSSSGDWGEIGRRVKEGGRVLRSVKRCKVEEEMVMWVVVVNGVEIVEEIGGDGRGGIGVAVYGPMFSCFNHSCSPNAAYRFLIGGGDSDADPMLGFSTAKVYPYYCDQQDGEAHLMKCWADDEHRLSQGLVRESLCVASNRSRKMRRP